MSLSRLPVPGPSGLFRDPCVRKLLRTAACQSQKSKKREDKETQRPRTRLIKRKETLVILPLRSSWWEVGAACGVGLVRGLRGATEVTKGVGVAKMEKETR